MADPYYRYGAPAERDSSFTMPSFPGYLSSEPPSLLCDNGLGSTDFRGMPSDFLKRDIHEFRSRAYSSDDTANTRTHHEAGFAGTSSGFLSGPSVRGYSASLEDPNLNAHRKDIALEGSPVVPEVVTEKSGSLRNANSPSTPRGESNVLYVDGLPTDCTRREVSHLFRPFIGYKDIKVVHREARSSGDTARVLCFIEFVHSKYALTAMEALQGYKFDDKKPDSPSLRIQFAHFPFRPLSDPHEQRG